MNTTTTDNALALQDAGILAQLSGMANREDKGSSNFESIPILKIQTDEDSKIERGKWVLSQKKDKDGKIVDEGIEVIGMVIQVVRNRFSYYNQKQKVSCQSPVFLRFNDPNFEVRGSKFGNVCGKTCSYRDAGLNPRCQAQKTVYGKALTVTGEFRDCVAYIKGSGYMPLDEYINEAFTVNVNGARTEIPPFSFVTMLSSEKKKNEGNTYWVPGFTRSPQMLDMKSITTFSESRNAIYKCIEASNAYMAQKAIERPSASMAGLMAPPVAGGYSAPSATPVAAVLRDPNVVDAQYTPVSPATMNAQSVLDAALAQATRAPMQTMDAMPAAFAAAPAPEIPSEATDVEALIAKALGN